MIDGLPRRARPRGVGLGLTVFVELKVDGHSDRIAERDPRGGRADARGRLLPHRLGAADFRLEVVVPDLRAYERCCSARCSSCRTVTDVRSNFAIRTVKAPGPLPLGHLA